MTAVPVALRKGSTIRQYRIVDDFTTAGGGQCRWAPVETNGTRYFLKEFLKPIYPLPEAPGSVATKASQRERCQAFEARHNAVIDALKSRSLPGGNLVVAVE